MALLLKLNTDFFLGLAVLVLSVLWTSVVTASVFGVGSKVSELLVLSVSFKVVVSLMVFFLEKLNSGVFFDLERSTLLLVDFWVSCVVVALSIVFCSWTVEGCLLVWLNSSSTSLSVALLTVSWGIVVTWYLAFSSLISKSFLALAIFIRSDIWLYSSPDISLSCLLEWELPLLLDLLLVGSFRSGREFIFTTPLSK